MTTLGAQGKEQEQEQASVFTLFPKLPLEIRQMIWERALPNPRILEIRQGHLRKTIGGWEAENKSTWPPRPIDGDTPEQSDQGKGVSRELESVEVRHQTTRSVIAGAVGGDQNDESAYREGQLLGIRPLVPPPHIISVCHESMAVVLRFYPKCFATDYVGPRTHFNFELDTLYIRHNKFSRYTPVEGIDATTEGLKGEFALTDVDHLSKVQNLAISIDESFKDSTADHVATILKIFTSVKKLMLVVEHFEESLETTEDRSQLCFNFVYDVHNAILAYDQYSDLYEEYYDMYNESFDEPPYLHVPTLHHLCLRIKKPDLERRKKPDLEKYGIDRQIPEIEHQILLPLGLRELLDEAREAHEVLVDSSEDMFSEDEQCRFPSDMEEDFIEGDYDEDEVEEEDDIEDQDGQNHHQGDGDEVIAEGDDHDIHNDIHNERAHE
ncbi:hypothetical protein IFR05_010837 [Cadophora sp. M221]|nr:hypothetical protein IFR05_010837 [Cadophora sp. M221]